MENDIKFRLIQNDEGEFEAYDCDYDITISSKSKEDQDEAIKKLKKGQASLQAWDKVKAELDAVCTFWNEDWDNGFNSAVEIINKHLGELQQEED